ncbi:unnamed protein product [Moneuplotes crassus]|uniref:RING-type domain-containing protein n=1 Tax=Euplotes crassus TaxID=5936 RepID=A0AAD1UJN1_EUPCR|nr:unnamed protein product [Moneuplotes crassus]
MEKSDAKITNTRGKCLSCFREKAHIFTILCGHGFCAICTIQNLNICKLLFFEKHSASDKFTRCVICKTSCLIDSETFIKIAKQASIDRKIHTSEEDRELMKKCDGCKFMYKEEIISKKLINDKITNLCPNCKISSLQGDKDALNPQIIPENYEDIMKDVKNWIQIYKSAEDDQQRQKSLFLKKLEADFNFLRKTIEKKYTQTKAKIEKTFAQTNPYLSGFLNINERIEDLIYLQPKTDADFERRQKLFSELLEEVDIHDCN